MQPAKSQPKIKLTIVQMSFTGERNCAKDDREHVWSKTGKWRRCLYCDAKGLVGK